MKVLYSDDMSMGLGGPITLVHLSEGWAVIGRGFFCQVDTKEEGVALVAQLKAERRSLAGDAVSSPQTLPDPEPSH